MDKGTKSIFRQHAFQMLHHLPQALFTEFVPVSLHTRGFVLAFLGLIFNLSSVTLTK